jgi:transposase-like protein
MSEPLHAAPGKRTETCRDDQAGYRSRRLATRIGKRGPLVPRDRHIGFSTALSEPYARRENALMAPGVEAHAQGVSTRKVKAIAEEVRGNSVSSARFRSRGG